MTHHPVTTAPRRRLRPPFPATLRTALPATVATATAVGALAILAAPPLHAEDNDSLTARLRTALMFHASFDHGPDADRARGERTLVHAPSLAQRHETTAGLPTSGEIALVASPGRPGRALQFLKPKAPVILFKAEKNFPALEAGWSGTLSFWLHVDPAADLDPGFCDPIQVTSKQWDDASIFVEFEKRAEGIPFRLGVYADKSVWNPQGRKWEDIPAAEKPLATVTDPPFAKDRWTHVAVTLDSFNTGRPDGVARLFLDGKEAGHIGPRTQTFTWEPDRAFIMLGLSYVGLMDDIAVFDRALTAEEIAKLHTLGHTLADLHTKR